MGALAGFGLDPIAAMQRIHAAHGPLAEIKLSSPSGRREAHYVLAAGAKYNKRVLSDPATFQSIGVMLPGPKNSAQRRISNGLLGPSGPRHAHYRNLMLPPLRRAAIDALAAKMAEIIDREIANWPINAAIDLFPLAKRVTVQVALETLFPAPAGSGPAEALSAADLITDHIRMESAPAVRGCPVNFLGQPYRRMLQHSEIVEAALARWVEADGEALRADNLMSILAHSPDETGAPPTLAGVLSNVPTLFAATFETSQTALSWALFLLAQHPSAAAALLSELEAAPGEPAAFADQLGQCEWLDAAIKESLRVLPSVPTQTRRAVCDTDLVDCDLPAGAFVILSAFLTNRNPALYPEPDCYRPERWAAINPNQYEYLAFSAGPRLCIGAWFATTFLKLAVGRIMRRYRLKIAPGARIDQNVRLTMTPQKRGLPATIHPQDGRFEASQVRGNITRLVRMEGARA